MNPTRVCFEPWGLGDALIAASLVREAPAEFSIACHPRWIPILRSAFIETPEARFLPVSLPYTTRARSGRLDTGPRGGDAPVNGVKEVLSIRGDPRDLLAAWRLFPDARVRVSGWVGFVARRSTLADLPYRLGIRPVRNRYKAWAELAGIPFERVTHRYQAQRPGRASPRRVVLHVGAQWRSRQYPHAAALRTGLMRAGCEVATLAGPGDPLPAGVAEAEVRRVQDADLVAALREAAVAVTNDSGPMHLAAFIGCRTLAIARVSNIEEWVPPGVSVMAGDPLPRGYRPDPSYTSDSIVAGWPEPEPVVDHVLQLPGVR